MDKRYKNVRRNIFARRKIHMCKKKGVPAGHPDIGHMNWQQARAFPRIECL